MSNKEDNIVEFKPNALINPEDVQHTTVSTNRLAHLESESRLLGIMFEHGVHQWDGYTAAIAEYRKDSGETA